ncbi:hypothetical protein [Mycobacterium interjectum]|uniref:hypothetical protein n=1 Tax=Mycobacterium interjectum TaxID=33895 RepID=UPI000834EB0C|nr:hypothetical protein [Mycobacterium interjectum]MCV7092474.1 hypothetical protein [Mycobacterium interjectum]
MATTPNLPVPPDAIGRIDDWEHWSHDVQQRMFTSWEHPDCEVSIFGFQFSDGRIERHIVEIGSDNGMTAARAQQRAAALLEAADKLNGLAP